MGTKEAKAHFGVTVKAIFKNYSRGAETTRDSWMYDFNLERLTKDAASMIDVYNSEVLRWIKAGRPKDIDSFVLNDEAQIKWSSSLKECLSREAKATFKPEKIRHALYRPFTRQYLFFDNIMTHRQGQMPRFFPTPESESENSLIVVSDMGYRAAFSTLVTNVIPDLHLVAASDAFQCFPFYTYAEDGSNRTENITDWALAQFRAQYGEAVSKRDIFHYVYAVLHHPAYRAKYAENLKRELPRIPLVEPVETRFIASPSIASPATPAATDKDAINRVSTFASLVEIGRQLAALHLNYESAPEYCLSWVENPAETFSYRVKKMKLTGDKSAVVVNSSLTLAGIPPAALNYKLGNRSALEWIIDQYQVKTDARSGLVSDPNREDDEEYIARLLGRVVTVSIETQKLIDALPPLFSE